MIPPAASRPFEPNFCPNCGCNIHNIAVALQYGALRASPSALVHPNGNNGQTPLLTVPKEKFKRSPWTEEERAECIRLYEAGEKPRQIALKIGRTRSATAACIYTRKSRRRNARKTTTP